MSLSSKECLGKMSMGFINTWKPWTRIYKWQQDLNNNKNIIYALYII